MAVGDLPMEELEENVTGNATLSTTLTGLDNYTVYYISIVAVTIGEGPVAMLSQRTAENGMYRHRVHIFLFLFELVELTTLFV